MKTLTMREWRDESNDIWDKLWKDDTWPFIERITRFGSLSPYGEPAHAHSAVRVKADTLTSIDFNKLVNRYWSIADEQQSPVWLVGRPLELEMVFLIQLTKEMPSQAYGTDPGSVDVGDFGYLEWPFKDHKRAMGDLDWWLASDQMQNVQWLDGSTLNLIRKADEWASMGMCSVGQHGYVILLPDTTRFLYMLALVQAYFFPIFNKRGYVKARQVLDDRLAHKWLNNVNASGDTHRVEEKRLESRDGAFYPSKNKCWVAYMASLGIIEQDPTLPVGSSRGGRGGSEVLPPELMEISTNAIEVIKPDGTKIVIQPLRRLQAILQSGHDKMALELGAKIHVEGLTRCLLNRRA